MSDCQAAYFICYRIYLDREDAIGHGQRMCVK